MKQEHEQLMRGRAKSEKRQKSGLVVVVVLAHIYPPVIGQRQMLTYWTIRTLFITTTTS